MGSEVMAPVHWHRQLLILKTYICILESLTLKGGWGGDDLTSVFPCPQVRFCITHNGSHVDEQQGALEGSVRLHNAEHCSRPQI